MAIKYINLPDQKKTIGVLENTENDAIKCIRKCFANCDINLIDERKYKMNNTYKASAVCANGDVYDERIGRDVVKQKVLDKYYKALDSRLQKFADELWEAQTAYINKYELHE